MDRQYDPNNLGSDAPAGPACEQPTAADLERFRENAHEANRLHDAANKLADRSGK